MLVRSGLGRLRSEQLPQHSFRPAWPSSSSSASQSSSLLACYTKNILVTVTTYLMPSPDRSETVHERNVFPKIRVEPETRWNSEVCDAEEDDTEDSHEEEKAEKTKEAPT